MAALVFNALTGPELINVILEKIREKLEATGEFPGNITFPWLKFEFTVGLTTYPKQSIDDAPGIVVKAEVTVGDIAQTAGLEPIEVKVDSTAVIDVPDIARIESNQPLPTTAVGVGGVLVDKDVTPVVKDEGRKPAMGYKGKTDGPGTQPANK